MWSKEEIHVITNHTVTAFLKIYQWGLQHCMNLLVGKITEITRRVFHRGSNNIVIFFVGKSPICQDWINENGLFVWICSEIYKHLTSFQNKISFRLGTKLEDWSRKRFKMITQTSSTEVHQSVISPSPLIAFISYKQLTGPWILTLKIEVFWPDCI